jgi:hypothetical protein
MHRSWNDRIVSRLHGEEGKGVAGCLVFLVLLGVLSFALARVGPDYYAFKSFEADAKTEASRAGANFYDDETIAKNIIDIARKNEIKLKPENVKVDRFAGQIFIKVDYMLHADFIVYERDFEMKFSVSSYVGRL